VCAFARSRTHTHARAHAVHMLRSVRLWTACKQIQVVPGRFVSHMVNGQMKWQEQF
jgi:hypothetical protein